MDEQLHIFADRAPVDQLLLGRSQAVGPFSDAKANEHTDHTLGLHEGNHTRRKLVYLRTLTRSSLHCFGAVPQAFSEANPPTMFATYPYKSRLHNYNFPYESTQLQNSDIGNNTDISFANASPGELPQCKNYPGYKGWLSSTQWSAFNVSLSGALLRSIPPAAACYGGVYKDAVKCANVRRRQGDALFAKEDPLIPFGQWQLDNPCPVPASGVTPPLSECILTSFPAYVVNATTVKEVQLAVNFARNSNIRLTIKNTGRDWLGRNTGGGALQVWVHQMKAFEYLPDFSIGSYKGQAARVGVALEQHEVYSYMGKANITLLAPGSPTIGAYGGFMQGGGFSYVTSKYVMMADQVLSLQVVTADGKFVTTDPFENEDVFWAIRGGGPGNFGIVTSAIVKAYPPTTVARVDFTFQTGPVFGNANNTVQVSNETFWKGVNGIMWNFIDATAPNRYQAQRMFTLRQQITKPGVTVEEMKKLIAPLIKDLNDIDITLSSPEPLFWETYADFGTIPGGPTGATSSGRFGSCLVPRSNLEDPKSDAFLKTMASTRSFVEEGGYSFHSYTPELSDENWKTSHARLNSYIQKRRDASPGSGAYMNEANVEEPNFQESIYGSNYDRLLKIKKQRDPWRLFYAVTAVGSEEWKVEGTRGLPTQQGRLCRVAA
ncbi:FAD/FMN-containing isoamyl alcohol oxidase-like protein MreA [Clathrospora elynae]|uniref:FAD/FMN-containing isoamyl alcohol oxidase-like protein MreA n=1 Tax=Clathrospora elynae TaxID=706981 RepID=A0A6A5TFE0_9PLEO|nr:FAD/FMN-containing isoamyl alcohol oxidase-like protein MreA [Clathrospora elynae]